MSVMLKSWVSHLGHISKKGKPNLFITSYDYYQQHEVCQAQHLATNSQGQGHNFDSNFDGSCNSQNLMSGPYLLKGLGIFIITLYD